MINDLQKFWSSPWCSSVSREPKLESVKPRNLFDFAQILWYTVYYLVTYSLCLVWRMIPPMLFCDRLTVFQLLNLQLLRWNFLFFVLQQTVHSKIYYMFQDSPEEVSISALNRVTRTKIVDTFEFTDNW